MHLCLHPVSHGINSSVKASFLVSEVKKFYYGKNINGRQNPNNICCREVCEKGIFSKLGFCISTVI